MHAKIWTLSWPKIVLEISLTPWKSIFHLFTSLLCWSQRDLSSFFFFFGFFFLFPLVSFLLQKNPMTKSSSFGMKQALINCEYYNDDVLIKGGKMGYDPRTWHEVRRLGLRHDKSWNMTYLHVFWRDFIGVVLHFMSNYT